MISLKSPWKTMKNDMQHDVVDICLSWARMNLIQLEQLPNVFFVLIKMLEVSLTWKILLLSDGELYTHNGNNSFDNLYSLFYGNISKFRHNFLWKNFVLVVDAILLPSALPQDRITLKMILFSFGVRRRTATRCL